MKTLLVVGLVLLLLILGLPLGMGMGDMGLCPACSAPDVLLVIAMCVAIVAVGGFSTTFAFSGRISLRNTRKRRFLALPGLDRPPQHA